jgi:hypothetical protein
LSVLVWSDCSSQTSHRPGHTPAGERGWHLCSPTGIAASREILLPPWGRTGKMDNEAAGKPPPRRRLIKGSIELD